MSFSSCSYCLFIFVDAPSDMIIPKAVSGPLPRNWWNQKKQLTHLTPIILPIISGFHLLPSVFVILFSCASKVRENVNTLRALPSWNSVIYGLHGFEAYKQRGESIWSAYKKKTWIIIRTNLHTPNLCLEGQQQGIMSFIQHFRDWLASWKKMFQVAKELEPLVFQISPLLSKLSATVSLLIWKTTSNPDIHSIWAKFPWKLHPWPWKNRPSNHQWPKSTGLLSHFLAFEGVEVFRNCPKDPKLQTRLRVAVLNIFIMLIDNLLIYWPTCQHFQHYGKYINRYMKHVRNTLGCYPYAHCSKRSPETSTQKKAIGWIRCPMCFFFRADEENMMIY